MALVSRCRSALAGLRSLGFGSSETGVATSVRYSTVDGSKQQQPAPCTPTQSSLHVNELTKRPVPLNVELTRYAPLRRPIEYGDRVADITLASFGVQDLEFFSDFLMRAAFYLGIPVKGPTPMPRKTKRWTVIKSPFAMAKTKENFERITYRRRLSLYDANPETVQVFLSVARKYGIGGVGVKGRLYTQENADMVDSMDVPAQSERESPLAVNKVDLRAADGDVAEAVLELLRDPAFAPASPEEVEKVKTMTAELEEAAKK